ncbi:MAG: hypothetical protein JNM85_08735 [Chthonomonas sp.]|nr:hypothetical protein [Chthonomonas sp.]
MPRAVRFFALAPLLFVVATTSQAQVDPDLYAGLQWREIGPWRGGRSTAVTGVVGRPKEFYAGFTGGGIWKSVDEGENWLNVSDKFLRKSGSVGCIDVSLSNPDIVVAGMGENAPRGNITHGDGVWRSEDAGATWKNIGLQDTQTIGRVRIHPTDPNTIYVAAMGHIYGPHPDRGVYKTTDAGKTWKKILFANDRTGAVDICLEPKNPNVVYATTWEIWRTPFFLNSGGPECRLWKSTNGGDTWTDLSRAPGLPQSGLLGKICIDVSPVDPKQVWATVEHADKGGLYRSNDAGATWTLASGSSAIQQRPWYFYRVIADTKDKETVYVLNVMIHKSTNGGKQFSSLVAGHVDNHDLWIDPSDNKRIISANDGGAAVSIDAGRAWSKQDFPTAQFYHVSADNALLYRLLGCQQDNSSVRISTRVFGGLIDEDAWTSSAGGESGYMVADPLNPDVVFGANYGGYLERQNHALNISRDISAWPEQLTGQGVESIRHRFQWTFPIVFSPHDPRTMYVGSQHVLRSTDYGGSWHSISPDLTTNDKSKQVASGGPITRDNTGVEVYCTVFTIAESPLKRGMIWAGSDDGLVHVTNNAGGSWTNVTPKQMPKNGLCSMVEASPHRVETAFLAVDNHENDDLRPYIFITTDGGKSWSNQTTGIPSDTYVRVVREDPVVVGMLYAGTESGVYVSFNGGANWQSLQTNLPVVPIHDLIIKADDLCAATHGRSFWILDNLVSLRQMIGRKKDQVSLFAPKPANPINFGLGRVVPATTAGRNPQGAMVIDAYFPAAPKSCKLEVVDAAGEVVNTSEPRPTAGFNRWSVTPRYRGVTLTGVRMWGGGPSSIKAPPGNYTVRLTTDEKTLTVPIRWNRDPRFDSTDADLMEQFRFSRQISNRAAEGFLALTSLRRDRDRINRLAKTEEQKAAAKPALDALKAVEDILDQVNAENSQDFLNHPVKLINKLSSLVGVVQSGWYAPTKPSYEVFAMLDADLARVLADYKTASEKLVRPLLVELTK